MSYSPRIPAIIRVIVVLLICSAFLISGCAAKDTACFKSGKCVDIEIVTSPKDQKMGLMKYDSIDEDYGMLFVSSVDSDKCMWMKGMKFPIDIIWLDEDGFIRQIVKDAPACAMDPCKIYCTNSRDVLELKAGFADRYGLEDLEKVEIKILNNSR